MQVSRKLTIVNLYLIDNEYVITNLILCRTNAIN